MEIFKGHAGSVTAVAVTPDGRLIVSGSEDNTLRLWELATGNCVETLEGHTGAVFALEVTPDSSFAVFAVSGSNDNTLRLWKLSWFTRGDTRGSISETGDKTLRPRTLAGGKCVRTFEGHSKGVNAVAATPDGRYVVSGGVDGLRLRELATGRCVRTFEGHTKSVKAVAVTSDGRVAVSGSEDKTLRLWGLVHKTFRAPLVPCRLVTGEVFQAAGRFRQYFQQARQAIGAGLG